MHVRSLRAGAQSRPTFASGHGQKVSEFTREISGRPAGEGPSSTALPLSTHLLRVPHARPAPCLPAHTAPGGRAGIVAPAPSRKCPAEHRCRPAARAVAASITHYQHTTVPPPRAPQPPLSGPPWPRASGSACDSHPESARHTGLRARGSCCGPPRLLVDGSSRSASVPAGALCGQQRAGLRCVDGSTRGANSVSERSWWGPN